MDFDISVDIAAPPDVVWAVVSDAERWHEWTESVRSIRLFDAGRSFTWKTGSPVMSGLEKRSEEGASPRAAEN
jgi:uncharacterized membrane protein